VKVIETTITELERGMQARGFKPPPQPRSKKR
jgi:hypothetical protein